MNNQKLYKFQMNCKICGSIFSDFEKKLTCPSCENKPNKINKQYIPENRNSIKRSKMILKEIPIEEIEIDRNQPRKEFINIHELSNNIKKNGLITPIIVERYNNGYLILDGHRRYLAMKSLGFKSIPCVIKSNINKSRFVQQIIVGLQKEDLNLVEQAEALSELMNQGYLKTQISNLLGVSNSFIDHRLKILNLESKTKQLIINKVLNLSDIDEIIRLKGITSYDEDKIIKMVKRKGGFHLKKIRIDVGYIMNTFLGELYRFERKLEEFNEKEIPRINKDIQKNEKEVIQKNEKEVFDNKIEISLEFVDEALNNIYYNEKLKRKLEKIREGITNAIKK